LISFFEISGQGWSVSNNAAEQDYWEIDLTEPQVIVGSRFQCRLGGQCMKKYKVQVSMDGGVSGTWLKVDDDANMIGNYDPSQGLGSSDKVDALYANSYFARYIRFTPTECWSHCSARFAVLVCSHGDACLASAASLHLARLGDSNCGFHLGAGGCAGDRNFFAGTLDNVAFYNNVITSLHITALYKEGRVTTSLDLWLSPLSNFFQKQSEPSRELRMNRASPRETTYGARLPPSMWGERPIIENGTKIHLVGGIENVYSFNVAFGDHHFGASTSFAPNTYASQVPMKECTNEFSNKCWIINQRSFAFDLENLETLEAVNSTSFTSTSISDCLTMCLSTSWCSHLVTVIPWTTTGGTCTLLNCHNESKEYRHDNMVVPPPEIARSTCFEVSHLEGLIVGDARSSVSCPVANDADLLLKTKAPLLEIANLDWSDPTQPYLRLLYSGPIACHLVDTHIVLGHLMFEKVVNSTHNKTTKAGRQTARLVKCKRQQVTYALSHAFALTINQSTHVVTNPPIANATVVPEGLIFAFSFDAFEWTRDNSANEMNLQGHENTVHKTDGYMHAKLMGRIDDTFLLDVNYMTFSAWVRVNDTADTFVQFPLAIASKSDVFLIECSLLEFRSTLWLSNNRPQSLVTDFKWPSGQWVHVGVSWGTDGVVRHYIAGNQVNYKALQRSNVPLAHSNSPFVLGNNLDLDDVLFFDSALSMNKMSQVLYAKFKQERLLSNSVHFQTSTLNHVAATYVPPAPTLDVASLHLSEVQPFLTLVFSVPVACMAVRVQDLRFENVVVVGGGATKIVQATLETAHIAQCNSTTVVVHLADTLATELKTTDGENNIAVHIDPVYPAASNVPNGLIASWLFDSTDPTEDSSGNEFHIRGLNASAHDEYVFFNSSGGKNGGAYLFNDASIRVDRLVPTVVHHCSQLLNTSYITITAWVFRHLGGQDLQTIVSKRDSYSLHIKEGYLTSEFTFQNGTEDLNPLSKRGPWTAKPSWSEASGYIELNRWTHVAVSYGNDGVERHFIDGIQLDFRVLSRIGAQLFHTMNDVTIGSHAGKNIFVGVLDELMIFERSLSGFDIYNIYQSLQLNQNHGIVQSQPLAQYIPVLTSEVVGIECVDIDFYSVQTTVNITFNISVACSRIIVESMSFKIKGITRHATPFNTRLRFCLHNNLVVVLSDSLSQQIKVGEAELVIDPMYPAASHVPPKLIAEYNFDGSFASDDASGNRFMLRRTSRNYNHFNSTRGAGVYGGSYVFDDSLPVETRPYSAGIGIWSTFKYITISGWIYREQSSSTSETVAAQKGAWKLSIENNLLASLFEYDNNTQWSPSMSWSKNKNVIQIGEWAHIAVSFGEKYETHSINGKIVNRRHIPSCSHFSTQNTLVSIGYAEVNQQSSGLFNGKLDEISIWAQELSPQEVYTVFKSLQVKPVIATSLMSRVELPVWPDLPTITSAVYDTSDPSQGKLSLSFSEAIACSVVRSGNIHFDWTEKQHTTKTITLGPHSGRVTRCSGSSVDVALSYAVTSRLASRFINEINVSMSPTVPTFSSIPKGILVLLFDGANPTYSSNNALHIQDLNTVFYNSTGGTHSNGGAYLFGSHVEDPHVHDIGNNSPVDVDFMTVAVWIFRDDSLIFDQTVVAKQNAWKLSLYDGKLSSQFYLQNDDDEIYGDPVWVSNLTWSKQSTAIPVGVWTHVAITYGTDGMERQYINGKEIDFRIRTADPITDVKHWAIAGKKQYSGEKPDTCALETATHASPSNNYGNIIGVTCCTSIISSSGSRPGCLKAVNVAAAKTHCENNNMVLCSVAQLKGGAGAGSGCNFDAYLVWSRDTCRINRRRRQRRMSNVEQLHDEKRHFIPMKLKANNNRITIGYSDQALKTDRFRGALDTLIMWNHALSHQEIKAVSLGFQLPSVIRQTLVLTKISPPPDSFVFPNLTSAVFDRSDPTQSWLVLNFQNTISCASVRGDSLHFLSAQVHIKPAHRARLTNCSGTRVVFQLQQTLNYELGLSKFNVSIHPIFPAVNLPTGLVAYWNFDDWNPTFDRSGNDFHLTRFQPEFYGLGRYHGGFNRQLSSSTNPQVDDVTCSASVLHPQCLSGTAKSKFDLDKASLCAWIKLTPPGQPGQVEDFNIVEKNHAYGLSLSGGKLTSHFRVQLYNVYGESVTSPSWTAHPSWSTTSGENDGTYVPVDVPVNRWTHLCATYGFDGYERAFIDARQVDFHLLDSNAGTINFNNEPVLIGTGLSHGVIDEVFIFNRALTGQEIVTLFASFAPLGMNYVQFSPLTQVNLTFVNYEPPSLLEAHFDESTFSPSFLRLVFNSTIACPAIRSEHIKFDAINPTNRFNVDSFSARLTDSNRDPFAACKHSNSKRPTTTVTFELSREAQLILVNTTSETKSPSVRNATITVQPAFASALAMPTGLIGYWPFDGVDANRDFSDSSNANGPLRLQGLNKSEQYNSSGGKYGGAIHYFSADQSRPFVNSGDSVNVDYITICAWVKPTTTDNFNIAEKSGSFSFGIRNERLTSQFWLNGFEQSSVSSMPWSGNVYWTRTTNATDNGKIILHVWSFVCASFDRKGFQRHFVNERQIDSRHFLQPLDQFVDAGFDAGPALVHTATNIVVGTGLIGSLDELILFDRGLTGVEIHGLKYLHPIDEKRTFGILRMPPPLHEIKDATPTLQRALFDRSDKSHSCIKLDFKERIACEHVRAEFIQLTSLYENTSVPLQTTSYNVRLAECEVAGNKNVSSLNNTNVSTTASHVVFEISNDLSNTLVTEREKSKNINVTITTVLPASAIPSGLVAWYAFDGSEFASDRTQNLLHNKISLQQQLRHLHDMVDVQHGKETGVFGGMYRENRNRTDPKNKKVPSVPYELIKSTSSKFNTIESITIGAWVKPINTKDFTVISKMGAWSLGIKNQLLTTRFGKSSPEDEDEEEYTMHPTWSDKSNQVTLSSSYVPLHKWSHGKFLLFH
jgi:hypothetical protein